MDLLRSRTKYYTSTNNSSDSGVDVYSSEGRYVKAHPNAASDAALSDESTVLTFVSKCTQMLGFSCSTPRCANRCETQADGSHVHHELEDCIDASTTARTHRPEWITDQLQRAATSPNQIAQLHVQTSAPALAACKP